MPQLLGAKTLRDRMYMYTTIRNVDGDFFIGDRGEIFSFLMGKTWEGLSYDKGLSISKISGTFSKKTYYTVLQIRWVLGSVINSEKIALV